MQVDTDLVLAGIGLSRQSLQPGQFPTWDHRCWIRVVYRLRLDDEHEYLTVNSSAFGVYGDAEAEGCLCRFDYERGKPDYPDAHLQIYGTSEVLDDWPVGNVEDHGEDCKPDCDLSHDGTPTRKLGDLHIPAGGRRYRPIVEDLAEFLIVEKLTTGRPGWRRQIEEGREDWRRIQLKAAVRRDPDTAREALAQIDSQSIPGEKRNNVRGGRKRGR